jgi:16S rRNA U516 pseudouridylate synthase RsuA-like enzyme
MHIKLGQLPVGAWRELTKDELRTMFDVLQSSKKLR